jgi:hypothetical protein
MADGEYQVAEINPVFIEDSEGCAFLFHNESRFISADGLWEGESLRWGPWLRGSWSDEQQDGTQDNAAVRDDGTLKSG